MAEVYDIAGRQVTMPVEVRDASAGTAMWDIDAGAARALLPGDAFEIVETLPGRTNLSIAAIDYRDNDLGDYDEVGITFFAKPVGTTDDAQGTFIYRLPVNQQFTCDAGRDIWGFPKSVEQIAIDYGDDGGERSVTCTLEMDGELVLRLRLPRGGTDEMPQMEMATYTYIGGVPHQTAFRQGGAGSQVVMGDSGVTLELGSHPLAKELESLGLPSAPMLSTWTEHLRGTFHAPRSLG